MVKSTPTIGSSPALTLLLLQLFIVCQLTIIISIGALERMTLGLFF